MFRHVVTSENELRALLGSPGERAVKKDVGRLDEHCRAFIARSPFVLLATSNAAGRCDVSPKGDAPGFVRVLDDRHLVVPDRPGNKRLDGMRNLLENPHAGMIFLVPGREETLRVNGRAWVVRDAELLAAGAARDRQPLVAIGVEVEECFFHCPKAFRRSELWDPARWPAPAELPTLVCVLYDQVGGNGKTLEEYQRESEEALRRTLY